MELDTVLPLLLGFATLVPLASFLAIVLVGPWMGKSGYLAGYVATGAILTSFALSAAAMVGWLWVQGYEPGGAHGAAEHHASADGADGASALRLTHPTQTPFRLAAFQAEHAEPGHAVDAAHASHPVIVPPSVSGEWYTLATPGKLRISIGYYIDSLTVLMFCMVTFIASCIHFYAIGYMHDELHEITDHEVTLADGHHLHRPGRFCRFFQYLSLFCFSMLGIVIAGNIAMVFVFWELVGICSYFLIGFYVERKSASTAANKAFIVNRVGDFGMIIGLAALFGSLGTFSFGDVKLADGEVRPGIFSQVRPAADEHKLITPTGMVVSSAREEVAKIVLAAPDAAAAEQQIAAQVPAWRSSGFGYGLLVVAGLGIFCGCVGKSAQFPLHVWLPDAMEGPTPVSALVHSATMVAAGVYLVGRFFPVFTPEVLLVIAYTGGITLLLAATIAITATDIKRVLAYSTVSQLGYMMLALGIGGWRAGLFHLITHAFFKSLLFMCSGSVIHACHTNEMTKMGGLRHKMPWTAYTMLVGCLAIIGAGIPLAHVGLSGYYSKDAILEQALNFVSVNPTHRLLFFIPAGGAAITAFYMFRLWFMTFAGEPRDHHVYDHAHESPRVMVAPLVVLSVMAVAVGWDLKGTPSVRELLEQGRAAGTLATMSGGMWWTDVIVPDEHLSHAPQFVIVAGLTAGGAALAGVLLAAAFYGLRWLDPEEARQQFYRAWVVLRNKWYFDELYNWIFVLPVLHCSRFIAGFDRKIIDGFIDGLGRWTRFLSRRVDDTVDRPLVDGAVNLLANWTYSLGLSLRGVQTGFLRQYVVFIVLATVVLFLVVSWNITWAG
ncbi:MAG: NADH-quinone oxidoreductase subunit L [Pirellulales bacterium]